MVIAQQRLGLRHRHGCSRAFSKAVGIGQAERLLVQLAIGSNHIKLVGSAGANYETLCARILRFHGIFRFDQRSNPLPGLPASTHARHALPESVSSQSGARTGFAGALAAGGFALPSITVVDRSRGSSGPRIGGTPRHSDGGTI